MSSKLHVVRLTLCLVLLGLVAAVPVFAGSAVIGSVAGSTNAMVGGQTLLPNTMLFSGDSLRVRDGVAVVAVGNTGRMVFGRDTLASFLGGSNEVTVLLGQGNVSLFHAGDTMMVRVKVGNVSVVPASGFKTLGEVATLNGAMVVTAKEGMFRVEGNGKVVNVAQGKTITLYPSVSAPKPDATPPGQSHISGGTLLEWIDTILSGGAFGFSIWAAIRAGDAEDSANSATSAANAATSDLAGASSALSAAAAASNYNAIAIGCALNEIANQEGSASPFNPTSILAGANCGNKATW